MYLVLLIFLLVQLILKGDNPTLVISFKKQQTNKQADKQPFHIVLHSDSCRLIPSKLGIMIDTMTLYSLIPVWKTLTFTQGNSRHAYPSVLDCICMKIGHWWSYHLLTFAYFKLFPGHKYGGSDWSKKFSKPMNMDFESFTEVSHLQIWRVKIQSFRWQVAAGNRQRRGRMQETKKRSSNQTATIQETTLGISESSTHGALLLEKVFRRCKQNKGIQVY